MTKKLYLSFLTFLFITTWCFGYIDPGSGSYVIQVIIAFFVGIPIAIGMFWGKVKTFFGNLFRKKDKENK